MKKMLPNSTEYSQALSEITRFTNKEGVFGDPDIMGLTDDNNPHHIPTYQFWAEYGEHSAVVDVIQQLASYAASLSMTCRG